MVLVCNGRRVNSCSVPDAHPARVMSGGRLSGSSRRFPPSHPIRCYSSRVPDWFNINIAGLIAAITAAGAALKAHVSARHTIAALAERIERIEKDAADREERIRAECETKLKSEVAVLQTKLAAHENVDSGLLEDVREVKKTLSDLWSTTSRIDKNLSAAVARLESQ